MAPPDSPRKRLMSPASTDEDQARRVKIDKTELDRDAITKRNQTASPLLRLPSELRNAIYAHVCSTRTIFYDEAQYKCCFAKFKSLHLTCRQMRQEAEGLVPPSEALRVVGFIKLDDLVTLIGKNRCAELIELLLDELTVDNLILASRYRVRGFDQGYDWVSTDLRSLCPWLRRVNISNDKVVEAHVLSRTVEKLLRDYFFGFHIEHLSVQKKELSGL